MCIKALFLSSCRLIYFGGYGCKTMGEMQNTPATNFILEDMSWVTLGGGGLFWSNCFLLHAVDVPLPFFRP